jgi:hypothetical protein
MKELLRSGDVVALSWLSAFLSDSGIDCEVFDTHTSTFLGSPLAVQRRLMVADEDYPRARLLLDTAREAGHCL